MNWSCTNTSRLAAVAAALMATLILPVLAAAQNRQAELVKKIQNPVSDLISVPFQSTLDLGIGPADAMRYTMNIQPVVPFSLNKDWAIITRTILPIIAADSPVAGGGHEFGLGDTLQSFFFAPKKPGPSGLIWGVGPVFEWPTATDSALGIGKWGAGLTAIALKQQRGWTQGVLANHVWSYAGQEDRADVSATFVQPFISHSTRTARIYSVNTEATYDWKARQWSVPINLGVSQLTMLGKQPVSVGVSIRYWLDAPDYGPEGFGLRTTVTYLFPK